MTDTPQARQAMRAAFKHRIRMCCIWSWAVCGIGFFLTFGLLAGFIPPHVEAWTANQVAGFYAANRTEIRIGLIGALFFSALLLPFFTVVSQEMREIEGPKPLLAPIQFGGAVILVCFFQIICLLWLLASFRAGISHDLIRAMNDYGWIVWTILIPTYSCQFICIALAGFMDIREQPLWPRWAAYANLLVASLGAGGCCSIFFKHGPFSWNGLIGWWVPTVVFALGMCMNMYLLHRHARSPAYESVPDGARSTRTLADASGGSLEAQLT